MSRVEAILILLALLLALSVRLLHMGGPLDGSMWRQSDTAYMAVRMMEESPPDLLRPKAPYRGTNDVKAAEFPIYPALASLTYKALGRESLPAARSLTLLFFTGSLVLLFLSIRIMAGTRLAAWTSVFYAASPLGIAYSRMVHPDFSILFFSHLFLYALLRFVRDGKWGWWIWATLGGLGAFLMKAPYCFFLGLLPGWWWLADRERRTIGRFIGLATVLILPLAGALWFNQHRIALEAPFEESLVYPMKWTPESSVAQFFGSLSDRMNLLRWRQLSRRIVFLVLSPFALLVGLLGLWPRRYGSDRGGDVPSLVAAWMPMVWLLGAGLYVLIIFPQVSTGHEYYALPLVAPASLLVGTGVVRFLGWIRQKTGGRWEQVTAGILLLLVAFSARGGFSGGRSTGYRSYLSVDWQRVTAGVAIRAHTEPDDLVLSVTQGRSTGWSDPRILYYADRLGWAIEWRGLTRDALEDFVEAGATVAAVLETPEARAYWQEEFLLLGEMREEVVLSNPDGEEIGWLLLFDLGGEGEVGRWTVDGRR